MNAATVISLAMLMAIAAALYSSVGHGGASAYIALMALFSIAPESMRPTALALNLVVATFAAVRFGFKGQTNWRLLVAFADLVNHQQAAGFGAPVQDAGDVIVHRQRLSRPLPTGCKNGPEACGAVRCYRAECSARWRWSCSGGSSR